VSRSAQTLRPCTTAARRVRLSLLAATVALAACGGGGDDTAAPPPVAGAPAPAPSPSPSPSPAPGPAPAPEPAPSPAPAPSPSPSPAPAPAPGTPGALAPLAGAADPFPRAAAAPVATALTAGSALRRDALSRDKTVTYQLTLNNTNGVQTVMQVPGGAFLDDVFLTTAEVTGIGSAVTSVVAAVRIDPGDLIAEVPITVNFVVPDAMMAAIDRNQLVGFVADPDGSNLHLVPIVAGRYGLSVTRPAVRIDHLGIAGIAVATASHQAALAAAWPTDTADQLAAALAPGVTAQWRTAAPPLASAAVQGARPRALTSGESPYLPALRGYFNDVVVPAFAAAYGDPAQIPAAIQTGFSFLRNVELTGLSAPGGDLYDVAADLSGRIDTLLDRYADYVADQCRAVGGPPQLQAMLGAIRLMQLQGHDAKAAELNDTLPQCSRFKASFKHDFTRKGRWTEGGQVSNVDLHTVIEGDTTFGYNAANVQTPMRLTRVENNTSFGDDGAAHISWALDNSTSTWGIWTVDVPVIRTRGGTPSTSVQLALHAWGVQPLTATETLYRADGTSTSGTVTVSVPLKVPALPWIQGDFYGPVLVPQSGSITSSASRNVPGPGGSMNETEQVTLTITKAD
jgi:hypothetical protein